MTGTGQTIYLHIGRGKTGTTALQRALTGARSALLQRGIHYPEAAGGARGAGHDGFAKACIDEVPYYMRMPANPQAAAQAMRDELSRVQAPAILISAENLELANPDLVRVFFDDIWPGASFRIILYVRSQDELAEAEYNQLVKLGRSSQTFADFADREFQGDFLALADRWETVFGVGTVQAHVYDAARPCVVAQLLASLGLDGDGTGWLETERTNSSVGIRALTAIRLLSMLALPDADALYARIVQGFDGRDTPALYLDAEAAACFRARFAASNRAFARRFLRPDSTGPDGDLGGRRHTDQDREAIVEQIRRLGLAGV
ncbi:hypothetical protein [Ruegeria sp. PrR005]|uniref:Uncharacterized protein n=1 Tax=Ruegeria sp. PrR005 TaxID=2706882 RepID=A0A6B2NJW7_9RHOB|nr:hypothetical protein [Ruegeria sp. PrR005]NDW44286.1 hypothetical protein [Ruegeria sp. PrR005]